MPRTMRDQEVRAVTALPGQKRYAYFVKRVADWQALWTVRSASGWALVGEEGAQEAVPVWSDEAFAKLSCVGDWADHWPERIGLREWLDRWLPGMSRDGRMAVVFPVGEPLHGVLVSPDRLAQEIQSELDSLE
jgi:hypothetical protein